MPIVIDMVGRAGVDCTTTSAAAGGLAEEKKVGAGAGGEDDCSQEAFHVKL
eukprot:COSAG02_NODE_3126_length_7316_cov_100.271997_3_plen_51_part_00